MDFTVLYIYNKFFDAEYPISNFQIQQAYHLADF
jgi:hypothetical protein